ncbi:hypothetical protein LCGC14_1424200 [marine sediment metagenome]|uniref:Uncharacterized protein n=1 Tax=marine sediment metagenome TaxID=412755 RepID=A0A0F9JQB4_9ZZZZ
MKGLPIGLILKLIKALAGGGKEFADAKRRDSPGGKKITKAEGKRIWRALKRGLLPVVAEELGAEIDDLDSDLDD